MRFELIRHPDGPASIADSIAVELEVTSGSIWLRYHAELRLDRLKSLDPRAPARADGLWKTTCFELFLRPSGQSTYFEFNFSPSSEWAVYRFADVRTGMRDLDLPSAPEIFLDASDSHFALEVTLALPDQLQGAGFDAGISAVIEDVNGTKSYWALAHPPGAPDFHAPDCFVAQLPPQVGA